MTNNPVTAGGIDGRGRLFVLSAPSGGGKSTIVKALLLDNPQFYYSVSATTRAPRPGEENGRHYYFLSEEEFLAKVNAGEFLENALVHGNRYGTLKKPLFEQLDRGKPCLLDIDVQGKEILENNMRGYAQRELLVTVFITPPDGVVLERRLRSRGDVGEKDLQTRLFNARREMALADGYRHNVVNDDLPSAVLAIKNIIRSYGFAVR